MTRNKIFLLIVFFFNLLNAQSNFKLKIIDSISKLPIQDVKIYDAESILAISDKHGLASLSTKNKTLILVANNYHDIEIDNISSRTIELVPITHIQLDEIIVNTFDGKTILDKIYNVYLKQQNYKLNYHFKNMTINLSANDKKIIKIDEIFYKGDKVKKNTNRIINTNFISQQYLLDYDNVSYSIPTFSPYHKNNFFYYFEINDFFKNYKKFKYEINEYENHLSIEYNYKDSLSKMKFKISLIIDKNNYCIISYKKKLLSGKNIVYNINNFKSKESQDFKFSEYSESVLFKINELGEYEIISENSIISYNCSSNGKTVNFRYFFNLEPSVPYDHNHSEIIDFNELIK